MENNYICIGKIVNTHGLKGELRIISDFEFIKKVFVPGFKFYIGRKKEEKEVVTYRHHKNYEMVTFLGLNNINDVLYMKGLNVYINKEDLILDSNEVLDSDLNNLNVIIDSNIVGRVNHVEANAKGRKIIVVDTDKGEVLVPYISEFVKDIDIENGNIIINAIEGMF